MGGIGKRPWVSQACWGPAGGGGLGRDHGSHRLGGGIGLFVADTMVTSSRVVGLLQMPWVSYKGGGRAEVVTMGFLHTEGGYRGRH